MDPPHLEEDARGVDQRKHDRRLRGDRSEWNIRVALPALEKNEAREIVAVRKKVKCARHSAK